MIFVFFLIVVCTDHIASSTFVVHSSFACSSLFVSPLTASNTRLISDSYGVVVSLIDFSIFSILFDYLIRGPGLFTFVYHHLFD